MITIQHIIVWSIAVIFWSIVIFVPIYFSNPEDRKRRKVIHWINCEHCGKPFSYRILDPEHFSLLPLCEQCGKEHERIWLELKEKLKTVRCDQCKGSGKIKGYKCMKCEGHGYYNQDVWHSDIKSAMEELGWNHEKKDISDLEKMESTQVSRRYL